MLRRSLRTFASDWQREQKEKEQTLRDDLLRQRSFLIANGKPTDQLLAVLRKIYGSYAMAGDAAVTSMSAGTTAVDDGHDENDAETITLDFLAASRLWYTCGLKLSLLTELAESDTSRTYASMITFKDFVTVIERVAAEDEVLVTTIQQSLGDETEIPCEVSTHCLVFVMCRAWSRSLTFELYIVRAGW